MRLYLVQHGEALTEEQHPERPLSPTGRADLQQLADFLFTAGIKVTQLFHSGKTRARESAEILASRILHGATSQPLTDISPNSPTASLIEQLSTWHEDSLIVGHLPHLARAVAQLTTHQETEAITGFQPGSVVCLEPRESGGWQIAWMLRPELLRARPNRKG